MKSKTMPFGEGAEAPARRASAILARSGVRAAAMSSILAVLWAVAPGPANALTPTHSYEFSGGLADDFGGPSMAFNVGANNSFIGSGPSAGLKFAANQGPNVAGLFADPGVYSMELEFFLDDLDNFRRIIDFKDGLTDAGIYFNNSDLEFYAVGPSAAVGAQAGAMTHLVVTRDADANFSVFHNGQLAFSFLDDGGDGILNQSGGLARFFDDDGAEGSTGFVDFIRTYDTALSAADVTALYNNGDPLRFQAPASAIPEPATWAMMILGFGGTGVLLRRRQGRGLAAAA